MLRKGGFIFTNRNHPMKAIMATVLGILAWVSILRAVHLTFLNEGQALLRWGTVGLLSFLFAVVGVVLAILSRMERDKYYLFSYLGMVLNGTVLVFLFFMLYLI